MMPAYSFQKQFVSNILDRSKPHTIRHKRKRPTKVGDMLMLYYAMRTKQCKLIAISECVKVETIDIYPGQRVMVNGEWLNYSQIVELAKADGFENTEDLFQFFEDHYSLPTSDFEIIWWSTELLVPANGRGGELRVKLGGEK